MAKKKAVKSQKQKKTVKNQTVPVKYVQAKLPLKHLLVVLCLFLVCSFLLYQASLNYGFVLDDKIVLSENNYTKKGLAGIPELFSTDSFQGYFGEQKEILQGGRYRPLSLVAFAIEYEIFGLNAMVFHLINILLYGFSVFIAFISLRRLFKESSTDWKTLFLSLAFLSSLLFLFHPIHTEAVANIKGRDEIMAFLFSMLTLLWATRYYDSKKYLDLVLANVFFLLGFFSKENTITFLAIVPAGLLLFRKASVKSLYLLMGTLLFTTVLYLTIRVQALGYFFIDNPSTDIMNNPFVEMSGVEKYSTIIYTLLVYLKLIFVPIQLTHDYYPFHIATMTLANWQVWLSILIHGLMVYVIFKYWKSWKHVVFGLVFYLAALSIVSNIVINVGTTMNERFIFTALLGFTLIMAYIFKSLSKRLLGARSELGLIGLLFIVIALYSFKTIDRVPVWESELALNQAAIKVSKNSARANSFMATAYFNRYKEISDREEKLKLIELARPYAEKAIELYPNYLNGNLMLAGIAAEEYKYDGNMDKLLNNFKEVATRRPDVDFLTTYLKYLNERGNHIDKLSAFYYDLGNRILLQNQQRYEWAAHYLVMGAEIDPNNTQMRNALIESYRRLGRNDLISKMK